MQRVCFLLKVRPERLREYRERHRAVWPEMLDALSVTGRHNYSLFLREDGLLIDLRSTRASVGKTGTYSGIARRSGNPPEVVYDVAGGNLRPLGRRGCQRHADRRHERRPFRRGQGVDGPLAGVRPPERVSGGTRAGRAASDSIPGRRDAEPPPAAAASGTLTIELWPGNRTWYPRCALLRNGAGYWALRVIAYLLSVEVAGRGKSIPCVRELRMAAVLWSTVFVNHSSSRVRIVPRVVNRPVGSRKEQVRVCGNGCSGSPAGLAPGSPCDRGPLSGLLSRSCLRWNPRRTPTM
ncbi:L-rhamnose mutarotase [Streptosporangium sp. CA-115845]|uniref:L-rhamnose mutarotase n=1 Tax=Streptosporangium sp. CA-115845 TaxID=3240071 RepID=UPI003D90572F